MFTVYHPLALPICAADDHAGAKLTLGATGACQAASPVFTMVHPFYCSLGPHDATMTPHKAAANPDLLGRMHAHAQRPITRDVLLVLAVWDDDRATDGLA